MNSTKDIPFVSICTPTYNRRPFIRFLIKCFQNQTYPKENMEWIIIDDGMDKVEDIFKPYMQMYNIQYFHYETKMTLGKKRNLAHEKCSGDIILYMDDDDYYPPERVSHAVETLQQNPSSLCVGSSTMYIYFKHISKMYKFGPYGKNHCTAATMAFRKELLQQTSFDDNACLAEEKQFLKNYTIPFTQLDPFKSILVFSHIHNSFDKKTLLKDAPNKFVNEVDIAVENFIKEPVIRSFFMEEIDTILQHYEFGKPEYKPDVEKQIKEITQKREKIIEKKLEEQKTLLESYKTIEPQQMNEMTLLLNELLIENNQLKDKVKYLEDKIKKIIQQQIDEKKNKLKDKL